MNEFRKKQKEFLVKLSDLCNEYGLEIQSGICDSILLVGQLAPIKWELVNDYHEIQAKRKQ